MNYGGGLGKTGRSGILWKIDANGKGAGLDWGSTGCELLLLFEKFFSPVIAKSPGSAAAETHTLNASAALPHDSSPTRRPAAGGDGGGGGGRGDGGPCAWRREVGSSGSGAGRDAEHWLRIRRMS